MTTKKKFIGHRKKGKPIKRKGKKKRGVGAEAEKYTR